jgi:hypothetical protein
MEQISYNVLTDSESPYLRRFMEKTSIFVTTDLYNAGFTEDGEEFHAELYYVVAEYTGGERLAHSATFRGTEKVVDEDGMSHFPDLREEAKAKAEALCKRIKDALDEGCGLHMSYWTEIQPVYGSRAYQLNEFYNS